MIFDPSMDTAPISNAPLGLPLLTYIQKDPLDAASRFQSRFGDVARLNILFRRIYYSFSPQKPRARYWSTIRRIPRAKLAC